MDNGLIFPYPLDASMLNLGMLTTRAHAYFDFGWGCVGERGI